MRRVYVIVACFFFNDTATTEIYTLSLHDALPIWAAARGRRGVGVHHHRPHAAVRLLRREAPARCRDGARARGGGGGGRGDRKSTRLNSSHANISYAVFCLKKKPHSNHTPHSSTYL